MTAKIKTRLKTHKHCTIFENELSRVWPYAEKEREKRFARINAFAKVHGWSATILDSGVRVTFRNLDGEARKKRFTSGT